MYSLKNKDSINVKKELQNFLTVSDLSIEKLNLGATIDEFALYSSAGQKLDAKQVIIERFNYCVEHVINKDNEDLSDDQNCTSLKWLILQELKLIITLRLKF